MQYGQLRRGLLISASAIAFVALLGTAPVNQASAQGTQGYSGGQNGGSTTQNGTGTRGESGVNGSGVGGPRDPARLNNANPSNNTNGRNMATKPGTSNNSRPTDPMGTDTDRSGTRRQ
jgi:hypothetical protein